jgi:hypothetical protein
MKTEMITDDEIAARAYEIHERNGRQDGRATEDWAQALAELEGERREKRRVLAALEPSLDQETTHDEAGGRDEMKESASQQNDGAPALSSPARQMSPTSGSARSPRDAQRRSTRESSRRP